MIQSIIEKIKGGDIIPPFLGEVRRVAQLVELRFPKPSVGGSSPSSPAIFVESI